MFRREREVGGDESDVALSVVVRCWGVLEPIGEEGDGQRDHEAQAEDLGVFF